MKGLKHMWHGQEKHQLWSSVYADKLFQPTYLYKYHLNQG